MHRRARIWKFANLRARFGGSIRLKSRSQESIRTFEKLDARQVLSVSSLTPALEENASSDLIAAMNITEPVEDFALTSSSTSIKFDTTGKVGFDGVFSVRSVSPSSSRALVVQGRDQIDDTLSLDFTTLPRDAWGSLLINKIIYNGGQGGFDTLRLDGGTFQTVTYRPTGKDSGILTYDDLTVVFTGLEPVIDLNSAYSLTICGRSSSDDIHVVNGEPQYDEVNDNYIDTVRIYETNAHFEEMTFANKTLVYLDGLEGNDSITLEYTTPISYGLGEFFVYGGAGSDTLCASGARMDAVSLYGNDGNDVLKGSSNGDYLAGGSGDDTYLFSNSTLGTVDEASNGGTDTFDFSSAGSGVYVDLTSYAVENVVGSPYSDTVIGNALNNIFDGGAGNDNMFGRGGNDTLLGGLGEDWIYGDDSCGCYTGADFLYGGAGVDHLFGGPGTDYLDGGSGIDYLNTGGQSTDYIQDRPFLTLNQPLWQGTGFLISGHLYDDTLASDSTITFGDALDGETVLVGSDGYFSLSVSPLQLLSDWISAWTRDAENLDSNIAILLI